jgi:hypothetical protein
VILNLFQLQPVLDTTDVSSGENVVIFTPLARFAKTRLVLCRFQLFCLWVQSLTLENPTLQPGMIFFSILSVAPLACDLPISTLFCGCIPCHRCLLLLLLIVVF